jgi:outer membrane protein assembly factor BamB
MQNENGGADLKATERTWPREFFYRLARGIAVVSAAIVLMASALQIANYLQLKTVDPLNSAVLQSLVERLRGNPEDQRTKDEIRALDLLARKAYFTRRWQIRTGSYILLASALAFAASLKAMKDLRRKIVGKPASPAQSASPAPASPVPPVSPAQSASLAIPDQMIDGAWVSASRARNWMLAGGALVSAAALAFAFLSHSALRREYDPAGAKAVVNYIDTEEVGKNWPSFRGPGGKGVTADANAPVSWNGKSGRGVLWKTAVPKPGYNSPVIWGDRLFLCGADTNGQEVYCFDRDTGAILWTREVRGIPGSPPEPPRVSGDTGYAAPTMATDGERAFAIFATGDIAGFDFEGNGIWSRNLGVPENHYGHSSSLMVYRDRLLVQYDHGASAQLMALDVKTGKTLWTAKRNVTVSWSSPILAYTGKRPEVILCATPLVASYNPENGRELWSVECLMGEMGPSAAYAEGIVFAATSFAALTAIDVHTKSVLWQTGDDLPDASSPLAVSGLLFLPTSYGPFSCLDAKTGAVLWSRELKEGSYASPVCAGDRVYLMDKSGVTHVFRTGGEYVSLGESPLGEPSWATPAIVGNRIYIRGHSHLFCIGSADEGKK